jgi:multiple sugar transport system permease protein
MYVLPGFVIVDTWQWLPFSALLFWAGMNGIPRDITDSAAIDGARGFFFFRKVLFPAILPLFGIVVLLRGMDLFKIIDTIYIITYGGPGDASEVIHFYAYRVSFRVWDIGYGSVISIFIFFIIEIVSALYVKFFLAGYAYRR